MDTRKRNFIKLSALAVSTLAANRLLPHNAFAAMASVKSSPSVNVGVSPVMDDKTSAITMDECQSLGYREMAMRSSMVMSAWEYLREEANKIENAELRQLVFDIYHDSTPRLADLDAARRRDIWKQLRDAGYTSRTLAEFLPPLPLDMRTMYPAVSAPGSGYGSHHSYPGGLITHVATNVKITSAIAEAYSEVYRYSVNRDIAMASQLLHDLHKPYVFQWLEDASSRTEQTLAGTGEHHVLSLAELLVRQAPAELVVAQACAHTHPGNETEEAHVTDWLRAASIIAGCDPVEYGLLDRSGTLPLPRRQEGFICHLGDHDFVLSVPAVQWTLPVLREIAHEDYGLSARDVEGKPFNSLRNMIYSQLSAMRLEQAYVMGKEHLRRLVHSVVTPV